MTDPAPANPTDPQPSPPDPPAAPPGDKPGAGDAPTLTQAQFNAAIAEERRTWQRQADEAAAKAKREAEEAAAAEQGEFKKLAEQRDVRIKELEPLKAQAERYEVALKKHLAERRTAIQPPHDKTVPPLLDKMDPADQLEFLADHPELFEVPKNGNGGIPPTPRATGQTLTEQEVVQQEVQRLRASGRYG